MRWNGSTVRSAFVVLLIKQTVAVAQKYCVALTTSFQRDWRLRIKVCSRLGIAEVIADGGPTIGKVMSKHVLQRHWNPGALSAFTVRSAPGIIGE